MSVRQTAIASVMAGAVVLLVSQAETAAAQGAVSDDGFYKGRTAQLLIGYGVGGGYDLYGRVLARHMGKHIPGNPTLVPQNMTGAGSLKLTNYLYSPAAPQDGSTFGIVGNGVAFEPVFGGKG